MGLTFEDYREATAATAVYPGRGTDLGLTYTILGVGNESGEAQGKLKKYLRGDSVLIPTDDIVDELGDVLWYLDRAAAELGTTLEEVARRNTEKLRGRLERGTLRGDGDRR